MDRSRGQSSGRPNSQEFSDDTTLFFNAISSEVLEQQAFVNVNNCVQYFHSLNLTTNSSKTNVLNIALRTAGNQCGPAILLDDSTLEEVSSSKFLGMHFDQGLTWNEHIDYAPKSAQVFLF
ncbi:hypothetical protein J6590_061290 [Homalodisca vitripennis]|nr:hypothetical protein J6590_061290 [Homalodisca vitripennis]